MTAPDRPILDEEVLAALGARLRHARRAALRYVWPDSSAELPEAALLEGAWAHDRDGVERRVFDNALALGRSFAAFYRDRWALADLPRVLPALGTPCFDGLFGAPGEGALLLVREGCSDVGKACHLHREALAGLLLGVTGEVLVTRRSCAGGGDDRCEDALHLTPDSPHAFGPIPDELAAELPALTRRLRAFDSSVDVQFLGVNERTLLVRIRRGVGSELSVLGALERAIGKRMPGLAVREVSPRSVMD